ncbi:MAG: S-methyl-5-thioribose-1-phosphate isomerase [Armatimonadetes bacterium]|nr:S-methyl-5-thioribose-1-phosphate isomerase [Armatimonadota bacterium]
MKIKGNNYRSVWMEHNSIKIIDQTKLPEKFEILELNNLTEVCEAILSMKVRGAPAIGAAAAFGIAQAAFTSAESEFYTNLKKAKTALLNTRPTAFDLFYTVNKVYNAIIKTDNIKNARICGLKEAQKFADENVEACIKIGEYGEKLIKNNFRILTHCNAGALATVDFGTALAPIRIAHQNGKNIFVFVDETRPRLQGAKLTAFELAEENIPHSIIADNAAGYFMQNGEIDMVITGADRIAANGDAANKIGTYEKAVLAKENNIPFYIAAPLSTIDFTCNSGEDIPIEFRDEDEILAFNEIRIAPAKSPAKNPAFDITPAKYITGIITEKGIFKPDEIINLKEKK